jgi:hypothetical protein
VHDVVDRLVGQASFGLGGPEVIPRPVAPPPPAAPAPAGTGAGGGTIDMGRAPGSGNQLEASLEIKRNCGRGGEPAFEGTPCGEWFGEAAEYAASETCPSSFDPAHGVWVGSRVEAGYLIESITFQPRHVSGAISVCLYVHDTVDSLVAQSRFALGRAHTRTKVIVTVSHGCKINSSVRVNNGMLIRGRYRERLSWGPASNEHVDGMANVGEGTEWKKELPGTYRYTASFVGNSEYAPSSATVAFHVRACSSHTRPTVSSASSR